MTMFVEHSPLPEFASAVAQDAGRIGGKQRDQQFWSSPPREQSSPVQETLEVVLSGTRLVNSVEFRVSRFPHDVAMQWQGDDGVWRPFIDRWKGTEAKASILSTVPSVLPNRSAIPGHLHPQHSFAGHWETLSFDLAPVRVRRIRLILQRSSAGAAPTDSFGRALDYSLAVMDFQFGYAVASRQDVPRSPMQQGSLTTREGFAGTDDILGSSLTYALRENTAASILNNDPDAPTLVWRSEPQPYPQAVVNFYADLRDPVGAGRVIDRIYMDPLNNGAHVSVYYADGAAIGEFDAGYEPLTATQASLHGTAVLDNGALHLGRYGEEAFVLIDNEHLGFDPDLPWWLGVALRPTYDQSADTLEHPIWDCGRFRLSGTATGFTLVVNQGDRLDVAFDFIRSEPLVLLASFDGSAIRLEVRSAFVQAVNTLVLTAPLPVGALPTMSLGQDLHETLLGGWDLTALVLKEEPSFDPGFFDAPQAYASVAEFAGTETLSRNALLRLDPGNALVNTFYPSGLFGGPANKFESVVWTPVLRDYTMAKGWMYLPAIRAKYIKLEFTNLPAEHVDVHLPTLVRTKRFPPAVLDEYRLRLGTERTSLAEELGVRVLADFRSRTPYRDFPLYLGTGTAVKGWTNTQVYVADDYNTAERLFQSGGPVWSYANWHPGVGAPRFNTVGRHSYDVEEVERTTKVGFVVGLRSIRFARALTNGNDDSAQYEDQLLDLDHIQDNNNWVYLPDKNALWSGSATRATATSLAFGSTRNVTGIQFAAHQSQPREILDDPNFTDPVLRNWTPVGDASFEMIDSGSPLIGGLLKISRAVKIGYWRDIVNVYPTWGDIFSAGLTYGDLSANSNAPETEGGIASEVVAQPTGGRLYAAARVVSNDKLTSPLWVQIYDSVTGRVLAEDQASVGKDQIVEWYTSYSIGDGGITHTNTWGDIVGVHAQAWPSFSDTFTRPDATSLGRMDSGQTWVDGPSGGLEIVSNTAQVTVLGQQSQIDTGTPWGTFTVTLPAVVTAGSPSASVPLLDLGGAFVLYNDGRLVNTTFTSAATLTSLTAGDVLSFGFLPTKKVPSGHLPGGTDPNLTPYALVFSKNGSWVATYVGGRGFNPVKAIAGAVGQSFDNVTWAPDYAEPPDNDPLYFRLPMPDNGSANPDGTIWTDAHGNTWNIVGGYTFADGVAYQGSIATATASLIGPAMVVTDVGMDYGTLSFSVTQLAATIATTAYNVAVLDLDGVTDLYLRANGDLVRLDGTIVKAGAVASVTAGPIAVRYVRVAQLSSAFKTTYSIPNTDTQCLIFLQNGVVQSAVSGLALWTTHTRGIAGYSDGSGHVTIHEGFGWAPDAATLANDTRTVTWDDVSRGETVSWADLVTTSDLNTNPVQARIVQKAASADVVYADALALFHDPIVWEFSNDGGDVFHPALDIRNNPNGVLLFPPVSAQENPQPPQNQLVYRVTSYGPDSWISHVVVRPWYQGMMRGVPVRFAVSPQGPNSIPYDHYPPIEQDPRFRVWNKPIPRDWFFAFRDPNDDDLSRWVSPVLSDALVYDPAASTTDTPLPPA